MKAAKTKTIIKFFPLLSLLFACGITINQITATESVNAYSVSTPLPTTINLNDSSENEIRNYYSSLENLPQSERQGDNLLKNLKTILKNGQKYYSYESGTAIWQMYEIVDRDWNKSPASEIDGYNSITNVITGYSYGTSVSSNQGTNPYVHALYVNRDVDNQVRAWDNHNNGQWSINREHLWPKSHGFDEKGSGGARGDIMHLWPGNGDINQQLHSNYSYGFVDQSSNPKTSSYSTLSGNYSGVSLTLGGTTNVFEPQDCDKGDIARALFYMAARYNYLSESDSDGIDQNNPNLKLVQSIQDAGAGYTSSTTTIGELGIISDLLEWNRLDPPDEFEIHRNNLLYTNYTNNRNPFIDFPEWAEYIWGSADYNDDHTFVAYDEAPTGYAVPSDDTLNDFSVDSSTGGSLTISEQNLNLSAGESVTISASSSDGSAISWSTTNSNVISLSSLTSSSGAAITINALQIGNATIEAKATIGGTIYTATCAVSVTGDGQTTCEDVLTYEVNSGSGSYSAWTYESIETGATYAGFSYPNNNYIQLRISDNASGIVSTKSSRNIDSITITWNSKSDGKSLEVYGSNSPYSSPSDLYDSSLRGELIGTLSYSTTPSVLTFANNYKYIGIKSSSGTIYLDEIRIVYKSSSSSTITSISASTNKQFYVGEVISSSDIEVVDNNGNSITNFVFADDGYQFVYDDAPSGGAFANKSFDISYQDFTTTLTVEVARKAYSTPSQTTTLSSSEFVASNVSKNSNTASPSEVTIGGVDFTISTNAYIYNSKFMSFGKDEGYIYNSNPFDTKILAVNYEVNTSNTRTDGNTYISKDGSSWVSYSPDLCLIDNYYYFKIAYEGVSSYYSNISNIEITLSGKETAINVANYIMYEDYTNQCLTKFDIAINYFNNLNIEEKTTFMTSTDYAISYAKERLEAWAKNQGKEIVYSDGDYIIISNAALEFIGESKLVIQITIIIGSILALSVVIVGMVHTYQKRKKSSH